MEYSCVIFKADYNSESVKKPQLRLRRWCAGSLGICYGFGYISIHFYVEITFEQAVSFQIAAYGKEAIIMDPIRVIRFVNRGLKYPVISTYEEIKKFIKRSKYSSLMFIPN